MFIKIKRISGFVVVLGMIAIGILTNILLAAARARQLTLVEKTRRSELIVIGKVSGIQASRASVNVELFAKGLLPTYSIEVELPPIQNVETGSPNYKSGDAVLVVGNKDGSRYMSKIRREESGKYEAAIKSILEYDVTESTIHKRALLISMLKSNNPVLQHAALWDLIYLDPKTRNDGVSNDDLLPALDGLARGSDRRIGNLAIQIIGKSHGRKSIPILINIMASGNARSAEAASRELGSKAQSAARNNRSDSDSEQKKSVRDWEDWWTRNKDNYK